MENIFIGLLGSLIILDTTVVFQFLISQPLITCSILGWFLGDIELGIQIGLYLQLLWLSSIPIGGAVVPEGNVASIVTGVMVLRYHMDHQNVYLLLIPAILYGLVIGYLGGHLVAVYRKVNIKLLNTVHRKIDLGHISILNIIPFVSISIHYIMMFVLISVMLFLGDILFPFVNKLPLSWDVYCRYGVIGIFGIGAGMVFTFYQEKDTTRYLVFGLLVGAIVFYFING